LKEEKKESKKLFQEAEVLKELDYPNIIKLFDVFKDDKYYYMVTEICSGGELFTKIQKLECFSERMAADYMKQLLSAVAYLHSKNICHRDLKPENLLLNSKSSDAKIKLIDFGISCKFTPGKKITQKFGTPYYIAPEVLNQNYDEKCDVWSCGVILYIMLCGYPPFSGVTETDIFNKILRNDWDFYDKDWHKISQGAKSLIKKMLNGNHMTRISAQEALNDKWIQKLAPEKELDTKILNNLKAFNTRSQLKQAIMTFIAVQLSHQSEKDHLEQAFKAFDENGDGKLTSEELIKGYQSVFRLSESEAKETVSKILATIDFDGSKGIDYSEFLVACFDGPKLLSMDKLNQAFKMFDLVSISPREMVRVIVCSRMGME
jgi:calcium-dependent protein kinase